MRNNLAFIRPPQTVAAEEANMSVSEKADKRVVYGVAGVVAFVVLGLLGWLVYFGVGYKIEGRSFTFVHDYPNAAQPVPIQQLFSEGALANMYEGNYLRVLFQVKHEGRLQKEELFEIVPWKGRDETSPDERTEYVDAKRKEFDAYVLRFKSLAGLKFSVDLMVDDTEGCNESLRDFIRQTIRSSGYLDLVSQGAGLELNTYRLSGTDFLKKGPKASIQQGGRGDRSSEIHAAVNAIAADSPEVKNSSVATGLFNALRENSSNSNRHVIIVSDMLENHGETANFYRTPPKLDKSNWDELKGKLQKFLKMPQLKGVRVDIYTQPTLRSVQHGPIIRATHAFYQAWMASVGAEVKTHF